MSLPNSKLDNAVTKKKIKEIVSGFAPLNPTISPKKPGIQKNLLPHLNGSNSRRNVSELLSRDEEKSFMELLEETRRKQKIRDEKTAMLMPAKKAKPHLP